MVPSRSPVTLSAMHCMVTWGSSDAEAPLTAADHKMLEAVLNGHAFGRAFPGAYVVALVYDAERTEIVEAFGKFAKDRPDILVLVSPAIPNNAGNYNGWLDDWDEINRRTV